MSSIASYNNRPPLSALRPLDMQRLSLFLVHRRHRTLSPPVLLDLERDLVRDVVGVLGCQIPHDQRTHRARSQHRQRRRKALDVPRCRVRRPQERPVNAGRIAHRIHKRLGDGTLFGRVRDDVGRPDEDERCGAVDGAESKADKDVLNVRVGRSDADGKRDGAEERGGR